ncbi:odorant receptor 94a-like [Colletes gigas]|uniref:odorant receptor 94a-like n=1 Tax=Colletes gigas TaxID=935657 RepID=UPI001C9A5B01|nr:odorant receptor 94a-like [Colletes gigas]
MLTQIFDIIYNVDSQESLSDNFYLTLGIFGSCCKMCTLLISRENYAILINTLHKEPFVPVNTDEIKIRTRFDKLAKWNAIAYMTVFESCLGWMIATSIVPDFRSRQLTYRIWLPYNYSSSFVFAITYGYQAVGMTIGTLVNIACDSLFSGLLIHTYCQFEILRHRLKHIVKNQNDSAKQCAYLHNHIYKFATMVNNEFKTMVLIQFLVSITMFCFDLYLLTQIEVGSKFMEMMLFAMCTLMQILYYCWYGNEIKLKSLEVPNMVIESNWTSLDNDAKKILLMIMKRATKPIEFSSAHLVSMNLETFKTILKTSYSAMSVLQQDKIH